MLEAAMKAPYPFGPSRLDATVGIPFRDAGRARTPGGCHARSGSVSNRENARGTYRPRRVVQSIFPVESPDNVALHESAIDPERTSNLSPRGAFRQVS